MKMRDNTEKMNRELGNFKEKEEKKSLFKLSTFGFTRCTYL